MKKFFVEKFNASDDTFKVTDIYINSGVFIQKGEQILSIESSKADIDIEANESGYIYFIFFKGDNINVGELFYIISDEKIINYKDYFKDIEIKKIDGLTISKKANNLLIQHGLSPEIINKKIIKEIDVLNYINNSKNKLCNFDKNLILPYDKNLIPIIIIGAGGGAKMCIDALRDSNIYIIVGLLDDSVSLGTKVFDVPVVGNLNSIDLLIESSIFNFVLAFGVLEKRKKRYDLYLTLKEKGCLFPNIIHSKAIVEKSVIMGEGNVILAGANVGSSVILGDLNYINNNSLISHDCRLLNNIHIAPSAVLASSINVKSHVLIGMNSTLYYGLNIGESTTILNGLIINCDIESNIVQKTNN
jgi:sugar O-acyltransferase (sialic acid O-acetyltransferase NeuD family)